MSFATHHQNVWTGINYARWYVAKMLKSNSAQGVFRCNNELKRLKGRLNFALQLSAVIVTVISINTTYFYKFEKRLLNSENFVKLRTARTVGSKTLTFAFR